MIQSQTSRPVLFLDLVSIPPLSLFPLQLFCLIKAKENRLQSADSKHSLSLLELSVRLLSCRKFPIEAGRTSILFPDRSTVRRLLVRRCSSSGN